MRSPIQVDVSDILSEQYERVVGNDNCVRFEGLSLQIPSDQHRLDGFITCASRSKSNARHCVQAHYGLRPSWACTQWRKPDS